MGKESVARVYEDFRVGQRLECPGPRQLGDGDRSAWIGFTGDPVARFADGARRVHPLLVLALAHGMVAGALLAPGREELGFSHLVRHRPVELGSTVHATCRVIGTRGDPDHSAGVVWLRVAVRDERGVVVSYVHWFRVPRRHRQSGLPADALPALGEMPGARDLHPDPGALPKPDETGGRFTFEDYLPGETIFHGGATWLGSGDIRRFARWFRLAAADHHLPGLQEHRAPASLILGLGYALAHDGLENRLGPGGVNALRTPYPVRPGVTLRAMSQVAAVEPLGPHLGAVRLRTFLFRDRMPMADDPPLVTNGKRYYDHIVLDVDYWELLPTAEGQRRG